jgi:hypothetical protein
LGRALLACGDFREAMDILGRGDLGPFPRDRSPHPMAYAKKAERMLALEARLPTLLGEEGEPKGADECALLAELCFSKKRYADSARLWSDAFAARPALLELAGSENRYHAARAAALAGCSSVTNKLQPAAARNQWRDQALCWMQEELAALAIVV